MAVLGGRGQARSMADEVAAGACCTASWEGPSKKAPAMTLLLLFAGLGGTMLLGKQFEAHRLRAFIFNFEIARHRGSTDV
jgi:hypothetical protein